LERGINVISRLRVPTHEGKSSFFLK